MAIRSTEAHGGFLVELDAESRVRVLAPTLVDVAI
jgi:hypothetical protein